MEALMSLTLDELVEEDQRSCLDAHLAVCERCAATWAAMQSASALLWSSPMVAPPASFVQQVMEGLERRERARRRWMRGAVIGGAILLSLLGVAGILIALTFGNALGTVSVLRETLQVFFALASGTVLAWARCLQVPLRLVGASTLILLVGGISLIAAGSAALWTWALMRLERRGAAPAASPGAA